MPIFGYSPDGIVDDKVLLEVKCLTLGKKLAGEEFCKQLTQKPKYLEKNDLGVYTLRRNTAFYTQIQFGLAVLHLEMAKLILYYNLTYEGIIVINVPRDNDFIVEVLETLKHDYFSYILPYLLRNKTRLLINKEL
jgi:hypothetical protein